MVRARLSRTTDSAPSSSLAEGIEGLCHISEIEERRPRAIARSDKAPRGRAGGFGPDPGREYEFKIVKISPDQHKIGLSYRGGAKTGGTARNGGFRSSKSSPKATIGDAIMAKRQSS